jgi:hypothetical protein
MRVSYDEVVSPDEYYGLKIIAKRMNWSIAKTKNMAIKYHFPLCRLPAKHWRGWSYYSNEQLILAWYLGLISNARRFLLELKGSKKLTTREKLVQQRIGLQPMDTKQFYCPEQFSIEQASSDTQQSSASKPSNTKQLELFEVAAGSRGEG